MSGIFYNEYPYTDFHQLNLTWLINELTSVQKSLEEFVSINALKYADPIQWDITTQYEKNTIVIEPTTGTAYISTQPVPAGVDIDNTDYWTVVFSLEELFSYLKTNLTSNIESGDTATGSYVVGQWVLWKNELYIVISDITAGDAFVPDSNIKAVTVEERVENEYYPDDELLRIHGTTKSGSIITRGDYHVYDPAGQAIRIFHV